MQYINSILDIIQKIGSDWMGVIISALCMAGSAVGAILESA